MSSANIVVGSLCIREIHWSFVQQDTSLAEAHILTEVWNYDQGDHYKSQQVDVYQYLL